MGRGRRGAPRARARRSATCRCPRRRSRRGSAPRCSATGRSCRARRPSSRRRWPAACGGSCWSAASSSTRARKPSRSTGQRPGLARAASGPALDGRRRGAGTAAASGPSASARQSADGRRRGPRRLGGRGAQRVGGGWPWFGRRLVTWSSYIVLTEPIPDRLADIGWTGGEGLADARFTLHYLRTTPDGRIAIGGGGGRAGFGGRIGGDVHRRRSCGAPRGSRAAAAVPVAARRPHRGRLGRPDRHQRRPPAVVRVRSAAARSTTATGTAATASGRRWSAGGSSRRVALERADDPALALPLANGRAAAAVPAGAGAVRRRAADPRGRRPPRVDGGAWRGPADRSCASCQPAPATARLPPRAGLSRSASRARQAVIRAGIGRNRLHWASPVAPTDAVRSRAGGPP